METAQISKKVTITYFIRDQSDEHEVECARNGVKLNLAIYDALNTIRSRLKYAEDVSDAEVKFLEELRGELRQAYIEEA